jgi:hypothetical protein
MKSVVTALVLFTVLVGTLRPLLHPSGSGHNQFGLTRLTLLSEPADSRSAPLKPPGRSDMRLLIPAVVSALLVVLKIRRTAFVPVPVRRLKLFSPTTTDSLPAED